MNEEEKFRIINYKVYEQRISNVWKALQTEPAETLLIKGWAAAQNYPQPYLRDIGDIDVAVKPEQYDEILERAKETVEVIDFHIGLRKLDLLDWEILYKNSRLMMCADAEIRIPSVEDHLRILIVHWLADGGYNKNKLWDIYYAVENRPNDFDWKYFLDGNGKTRRKWFVVAIGLVGKYFGLNLENTPIAEEAKNIPDWIIKTVEKEWEDDVKFNYLHNNLTSGRQFIAQLRKRIPPNPIQSTVNMEGEFDNRPRIIYQIGDMIYRLPPSIKRVSRAVLYHLKIK